MPSPQFAAEIVRWNRMWSRQNRAQSTFDQYVREVEAFQAWCSETGRDSASLDSADAYVAEVEQESRHMARMAARGIKAYGKYLAEEYEQVSPYKRLRLPKEPEPRNAPTATVDDLEKLLDACKPRPGTMTDGFREYRDRAIILTMADTGLRRGEIASMQLEDLDLAEGLIRVHDTKNGSSRGVYLTERVVGAILRYLRHMGDHVSDGALWRTHAVAMRPLTASGVGQMLAKRGKAAGVDVRAHAFRRMHAGEWMKRGGSETAS